MAVTFLFTEPSAIIDYATDFGALPRPYMIIAVSIVSIFSCALGERKKWEVSRKVTSPAGLLFTIVTSQLGIFLSMRGSPASC